MYIGLLHVKCRLLLLGCNGTGILWTEFRRILKYQISWKSVRWKQRHDEANKSIFAILRTPLKLRLVLPLHILDTAGDRSRTRWRFGLHLLTCPVITSQSAAVTVSLVPKICRCTHKSMQVAILCAPNWRTVTIEQIRLRRCGSRLCADFGTVGLEAVWQAVWLVTHTGVLISP